MWHGCQQQNTLLLMTWHNSVFMIFHSTLLHHRHPHYELVMMMSALLVLLQVPILWPWLNNVVIWPLNQTRGTHVMDGSGDWITKQDTWLCYQCSMMTSSNGSIFRVTGLLYGEFTGHRWIPYTKAIDAELWCFLWSAPETTVQQTIETLVIWDAISVIMAKL